MADPAPAPPRRRSPFGESPPDDIRMRGAIVRTEGLGEPEAASVGADGSIEMLALGPRIWLAVSDRGPEEVRAEVAAAARRAVACTDLTHARAVLRVAGDGAKGRLARGCPMDLDTIEPGAAAATMLGHFEVVIHRGREPDAFEVYVARSVARSAREWLYAMDGPDGPGA